LREDLELADVLLAALGSQFVAKQQSLRQYVRRARRLVYASTIISCYGIVEQTVDAMLMATAETYNEFYPSFGEIPESVRVVHRELLLQTLRDGERSRTRSPIDETDALVALGLGEDDPPALVPTVFTLTTANYRLPYVKSLFSRIGIDAEKGLYHGRADEALVKSGFRDYESFMADLVQRRNDLAHSYGDEDIIDRDLLSAYVEIVESWMLDLVRLVNLFAIKAIRDWKLEPIAFVTKEWTGRVGIDLEVGSISVRDRMLLFKDDWCTSHEVRGLRSREMQADAFSFAGEVVQVGAKIDAVPAGAKGCEVFVIPPDLAEYWPSLHKWGFEDLS
jgi:hypothetical protein